MTCRLRVDPGPGPLDGEPRGQDGETTRQVVKALRRAGHDVDVVSPLLTARSAPADEVFVRAGLDDRVFVTADATFADVGRFEIASSPGLVLLCLRASTMGDALDAVLGVHAEGLQSLRRALADVATSAKRLELQAEQLARSSARLDESAKEAVGSDREDDARAALVRRASIQLQLRRLNEDREPLDELGEALIPLVQASQRAIAEFRAETDVMKAAAEYSDGGHEEADLGELTGRLVEALAQGAPNGALWLVVPVATWEVPAAYLKGRVDASPRPRRLDA